MASRRTASPLSPSVSNSVTIGPAFSETRAASRCSGSTEKLRPRSARRRAPSIASRAESANCFSDTVGALQGARLRLASGEGSLTGRAVARRTASVEEAWLCGEDPGISGRGDEEASVRRAKSHPPVVATSQLAVRLPIGRCWVPGLCQVGREGVDGPAAGSVERALAEVVALHDLLVRASLD